LACSLAYSKRKEFARRALVTWNLEKETCQTNAVMLPHDFSKTRHVSKSHSRRVILGLGFISLISPRARVLRDGMATLDSTLALYSTGKTGFIVDVDVCGLDVRLRTKLERHNFGVLRDLSVQARLAFSSWRRYCLFYVTGV